MRHATLAASAVLALLCFSSSFAQEFSRAGTFEIGGVGQWFSGETIDGEFRDVEGDLELDSLFSGGVNFGYHINNYLNINTDFVFSEADVTFNGGGLDLDDDASFLAWTVNLDYYVFPTRFTPFLSAGVGILSVSNDYDDDWYYDYYYHHRRELPLDDVNFLWNVGGGLRWNATDNVFLKLAYRLTGSEFEYSSDHMIMHSVALTVGYMFTWP